MNYFLCKHSKQIFLLLLISSLFLSDCDSDINSSQNRYEVLFDSLYSIGDSWSEASDIFEVSSGGYIIAGRASQLGNSAVLMRINENGNQIWNKIYSGSRLQSVIETNDNGFVAAGKSDDGAHILRTDQQGNVLWEQSINFPFADDARKIIQTKDGDFLIPINSNEVNTEARLVRLTSSGIVRWIKIIEGDSRTLIFSVSEELDGNLKLLGASSIDSTSIGWISTLDREGNELKRNLINADITAVGSTWHESSTIRTNSGGFAGVGWELFIVIDSSGNLKYKNTLPTPYSYDQIRLYSLFQKKDNNYIAAGFQSKWVEDDSTHIVEQYSYGGLFFLTSDGKLAVNIVIGENCKNNAVTSVIVTRDNSIVISGYFIPCDTTDEKFWVKKIRML